MSWIKIVPEADATGPLASFYADVRRHAGGISNILKVESLNPAALRGHLALYRSVMFADSPLSRAEREAVALVVSATNGCHY